MQTPAFFAQIPPLRLVDPLAAVLGAADGGVLEYHYIDAVKWAGHSCPTVAGAWLITRAALRTLYGDALPERGGLSVALREAQESGTAGVVGGVIGLLTGAAGVAGFKGLGGRFGRANLLTFGVDQMAEARFTRRDTLATVALDYQPAAVPADPALPALMQRLLSGQAEAEEKARFGQLWQERVRRILIDHADDPDLVGIRS